VEALLTIEARETASGSYHLTSEDSRRSLCGTVDADSPFAAETYRVPPAERAAELGFDRCGRCEAVAESSGRTLESNR